ncbi:MAG: OmpA family protein [Nitrospirae bacterium]|nr:OmpA family protein [Nitrospirota bacterium]
MDMLKKGRGVVITLLVMLFVFSSCSKRVTTVDKLSPDSKASRSNKIKTSTIVNIEKPYINNETEEVITEPLTMLNPDLMEKDINSRETTEWGDKNNGENKDTSWLINLKDVFYDYDAVTLKDEDIKTLDNNVSWLSKKGSAIIRVEGYADERGTNEYNLSLGEKRVNIVKRYLIARGISPDRIEVISFGEEKGFCSEHTEDCWVQNRRGHFVIAGE